MFKTSLTVLQPIEDQLKECEEIMNEYTNLFFKQEDDEFVPIKHVARSFSLSLEGKNINIDLIFILKKILHRNGST